MAKALKAVYTTTAKHDVAGPQVLAQRDGFRAVYKRRDQQADIADLYLEREQQDAVGNPRWDLMTSWVVSAVHPRVQDSDAFIIILRLLTTNQPVVRHG